LSNILEGTYGSFQNPPDTNDLQELLEQELKVLTCLMVEICHVLHQM